MSKRSTYSITPILLILLPLLAGTARSQTAPPTAAQAAPLTLQQAVDAALEKNPDRKVSAANVASAGAAYRLSRIRLLPQVGFTENITRSDDPVFAFGAKLRQQVFSQADFTLDALNRPAPVNNFMTRFGGQWTAFDSWGTEFHIRQASLLRESAAQSMGRTDQELIFRVVTAYESVLIAKRNVEVAQRSLDTAQSVLGLSQSRVKAGTVVESDALSAEVNIASRKADLIRAQGDVAVASVELGNAMGVLLPPQPATVEDLRPGTYTAAGLEDEIATALRNRPDIKSLDLQKQAQQSALKAAKSAFGPRVDTYGSWEMDKPSFAGAGGNNWTVGAELRIDLFPAEKRQQLAVEKAGLQRLLAGQTSAESAVRLQVSRAYYQHLTAQQTLAVTKASLAQATESVRILHNRYEAGLATVTDVLRAEDAERQSQTSYWQAVYQNTITFAALRLATGTLNPDQVVNFQ